MKLLDFQHFYNRHRTHAGLDGCTADPLGCRDSRRLDRLRVSVCFVPEQSLVGDTASGRFPPCEFVQGSLQHNWGFATHSSVSTADERERSKRDDERRQHE
jgi:hypothetical protein